MACLYGVNLINAYTGFYKGCEKGLVGLLKKYGGSFLTFDDSAETFEGQSPR
tara:strand:+ start:639 stop:794 length:156 start_codon:yes stop_codon:yes gene_type:complete